MVDRSPGGTGFPPQGWARIKELFQSALERPAAQRAAFLEQACAGDAPLRAQLEEMLRAHEARDSLLDDGPPGLEAAPVAALAPGRRVAHFRILRELGTGGMGTVFEAEQEHPNRRVALKVLRAGVATEAVVRRFRQEVETLGRLHHPGIAQIHEAGVEAADGAGPGVPWFSMELVAGATLAAHAVEHRLPVRARVELFVKVCDAVHHAHEQGVIHRDLKPSNVLVDADGQPKVLDFGVARVLDADGSFSTMHTGAGEMLGTLAYMSPEQARGDSARIDRRSDVYALGVVLYELLSARLPYPIQGTPLPRAIRIIEEEEPTRLTSHDRALPRDLETIVLKALEKDPARRYDRAAALAEDLRRFLRDEPIHARPASTRDQIVKFARRHRAAVAGIVAVFVVLLIGIIGTSFGLVRASRAANVARVEADTSAAVGGFLAELLTKGNPLDHLLTYEFTPGAARERKLVDVLREAAPTVDERFLGKPEVEAPLREAFGRAFFGLGLWKEAERELRRAGELFRGIGGADDLRALHVRIPHIWVLEWLGRYDEAERIGADASTRCERLLGARHRDTLAARIQLACSKGAHRDPAAPDELDAAIAAATDEFGEDDLMVLGARTHQISVLMLCGRSVEEYEAYGRDTLERIRRALGEDAFLRHACENLVGNAVANRGDSAGAEQLYRSALAGYRRHLGEDHPWTLLVQGNVGRALIGIGRFDEAEPLLRDAAAKLSANEDMGPLHLQTAPSMNGLANLLERTRRFDEAIEWRRKVLKVYETQYGSTHPDRRRSRDELAATLRLAGRTAEADALGVDPEHAEPAASPDR
jgi:serine/threonine protein kinase